MNWWTGNASRPGFNNRIDRIFLRQSTDRPSRSRRSINENLRAFTHQRGWAPATPDCWKYCRNSPQNAKSLAKQRNSSRETRIPRTRPREPREPYCIHWAAIRITAGSWLRTSTGARVSGSERLIAVPVRAWRVKRQLARSLPGAYDDRGTNNFYFGRRVL